MLETLNLLVGLAVVIMLLSFAVTLITQFMVDLLNVRGWALRSKVKNLLVLIDNGIDPKDAGQIAGLVLRNALVGKPGLLWRAQAPSPTLPPRKTAGPPCERGFRTASVIQREELTRLLLAFGKIPSEYPRRWHWFCHPPLKTDELQDKMRKSLERNDVPKPEDVLDRMRLRTLELERSQPELSNSQRQAQALLEAAPSAFLGKLNGWFDQTVDRASDRFTAATHLIAFLVALLVAGVLQLDSIALINRLSADRQTRSAVVGWATRRADAGIGEAAPPGRTGAGSPTDGPPATKEPLQRAQAGAADGAPGPEAAAQAAVDTKLQRGLSSAAGPAVRNELIPLPDFSYWLQHWTQPVPCAGAKAQAAKGAGQTTAAQPAADPSGCTLPPVNWLGVALSVVLLSLGGPFWYSTLSGLLKLRSTLADKDDTQRNDRQTNTAPKPAT